jgi:hypothetical protein
MERAAPLGLRKRELKKTLEFFGAFLVKLKRLADLSGDLAIGGTIGLELEIAATIHVYDGIAALMESGTVGCDLAEV